MADLGSQALWSAPTPAICNAHIPPQLVGAFLYDHLGRVEQTYVAKGAFILVYKIYGFTSITHCQNGKDRPQSLLLPDCFRRAYIC